VTKYTSKGTMRKQSVLTVFLASLLAGCGLQQAPACPFSGAPVSAPSAGCLSVRNGALLVVEDLRGRISTPGGSSDAGEAAQCTAYRETWEETGLRLVPAEKLATFETGFELFRCNRGLNSGVIDPPLRLEVRQAFYLPLSEFDRWTWRYPEQEEILARLLAQ
jgi:8-oxo-dGTP diphosphatase